MLRVEREPGQGGHDDDDMMMMLMMMIMMMKVVMLENENTPGDISLVTDSRDPSLSPKRTNSPKRQE